MKNGLMLLAFLASSGLLVAQPQQLIDISVSNSENEPPYMSGEAVLGLSTNDKWNIVTTPTPEPAALVDTTGGTTTATFSTDLPYANYNSSSVGNLAPALFNNFAFTTSDEATLDFGGLAKDTLYTLVLYSFNSDNNLHSDFTYSVNGGVTRTFEEDPNKAYTSDAVGDSGLIYSGNYVELTAESSSSGALDVALEKASSNTAGYLGISGIQLEVPEPSTWVMMVAGWLGLVGWRRLARQV